MKAVSSITFSLVLMGVVLVQPATAQANSKTYKFCIKTIRTPAVYLTAERNKKTVRARGLVCSSWEVFRVKDLNGGKLKTRDKVTIKSHHNRYFSATKDGHLDASAKKAGRYEKFEIIKLNNGTVRFKSARGKYLVATALGKIKANRKKADTWETFKLIKPSKNQDNLLSCINKLPKKKQPFNLIKAVRDMLSDPAKFAKSFHDKHIKPRLTGVNGWVQDEVYGEFKKKYPFGINANDSKWAEKLIGTLSGKFEILGQKAGLGAFGCMVKHAIRPISKTLNKHIISSMKRLNSKMVDVWEKTVKGKLKKQIEEAVSKRFKSMVASKKNSDNQRIIAYVQQSARAHSAKTMKAINTQLAAYENRLSQGKTALAQKNFKNLKAQLNKGLSVGDMSTIAGDAMERFANEKIAQWRSTHFDPVVARGLDVMSSLLTTAEQNFTGFCGLIPEIGAIICAQFAVGLHMTWDWVVRPKLMKKAVAVFTERTKAIVKTARNVMEDHMKAVLKNKSARNAGARYGTFGKTINSFVTRFASTVKSELRAENTYRTTLLALLTRVNAN